MIEEDAKKVEDAKVIIKNVAGFVTTITVGSVVSVGVASVIPEDMNWFKRQGMKIGAALIGFAVVKTVNSHVNEEIDRIFTDMQPVTHEDPTEA